MPAPKHPEDMGWGYALSNHLPLVYTPLDLLAHTRSLYAQAQFDTAAQRLLGLLGRVGQKLLDAVLARQFDQLRLPPQRVLGVVPLARDGVFCGLEGVRSVFLVACLRERAGRRVRCQDRRRRIPRQEGLQARRQRPRKLDVARCGRGHRGPVVAAQLALVVEVPFDA